MKNSSCFIGVHRRSSAANMHFFRPGVTDQARYRPPMNADERR